LDISVEREIENKKEELREKFQNFVEIYIERAEENSFIAKYVPLVVMQSSPNIIYFQKLSDSSGRIVVSVWEELIVEQKNLFNSWASRVSEDITGEYLFKELFEESFSCISIAHEMTHYLQFSLDLELTRWDSENQANIFAVAFMQLQEDGEERLKRFIDLIRPIYEGMEDPTPEGEDLRDYFNKNYRQLMVDPEKYGYYQFKQTIEAYDNRDNLNFDDLVKALCHQKESDIE